LDIATDESELATTLSHIMENQQAIILNPAYTILFESLGMLKVLKELYPDSPYLLNASFDSFNESITRTVFGEGEEFSNFKKVYLEDISYEYNAKVFFAYEACGLSFLSETESFITHTIK
jgi:glutathionylspermidine synthase